MRMHKSSIVMSIFVFQSLSVLSTIFALRLSSSPAYSSGVDSFTEGEPELEAGLSKEEIFFQDFIRRFNKTYSIGTPEYYKRLEIFEDSLSKHEFLNAAATHPDHAKYGVTKFSDLTREEFKSHYLGHVQAVGRTFPTRHGANKLLAGSASIPNKYDLRSLKPSVVTPVKNQKSCGACWAFSVVETIETKIAMKTKRLTELSPQELVDCGTAAGDSGCHGGIPCKTFSWLNKTKTRLVPESIYPYKAKKGVCQILSNYTGNAVVSDYSCGNYTTNETVDMPTLLHKQGPLSIAVDAESWQYYLGGIIQYHCTPKYLNHAVQIVGYDKTGPVPFYIVRNSWGANWGIDGYLRIKIGGNVCGVASSVQTVIV